jgi:hypothetical protein
MDDKELEKKIKELQKMLYVRSRWNYIACGISGICALFFAMVGNLPMGLLQLFFAWWNWNLAEAKYETELHPPKEDSEQDSEDAE